MNRYLVWCPERGEKPTFPDSLVLADNERSAAERYAERLWSGIEPFTDIELRVDRQDGPGCWTVNVEVQAVPEFFGRTQKVVP